MKLYVNEHNWSLLKKKKAEHEETNSSTKIIHCQAVYILQQTSAYSVIIFTILIMWLYSYNETSNRKLNLILYFWLALHLNCVITWPYVSLTAP